MRRSLLPAIVVGVALGIFCQRRPRTGRIVLAAVGLLQTIPSLALLVLLLPLVAALGLRSIGEGSVTAVTALFCYCLLPIVRNTYTGLEGVQRGTIESATVLGLGPVPRLVDIELPIALPTILAGIRGAAAGAQVSFSRDGSGAEGAGIAIAVIGEKPYAEFHGDRTDLHLDTEDVAVVDRLKSAGIPVVVVLVSGRPLLIDGILDKADAIVAAWLPGSEGDGVADILFGDHKPIGKLSFTWPRGDSTSLERGNPGYKTLFAF